MLTATEYRLENLPQPLGDVDFADPDYWAGVTAFSHDREQLIVTDYARVELPEKLRFPIIRIIDRETFLVADARTAGDRRNAWIIDDRGRVKANFYAGDAVEEIVVTENFLVFAYFDESYGSRGVERERLTVFDHAGNYVFGYQTEFSARSVDLFDCYAAAFAGRDRLVFFSYTGFPLVLLDAGARTQRIWPSPPQVAGAHAVSERGGRIYFHGPYADKKGIYEWKTGDAAARKIADCEARLRGLSNGRFFAGGDSGYTIISLQ